MNCILLTWTNDVTYFNIADPIAFLLPDDTPEEVVHGVVASIYQRATCQLEDLRNWASYSYESALAGKPVANGPGLQVDYGPEDSERITFTQTGDKVTLVARRVTDFDIEADYDRGVETVRWSEPDGKRVEVQRASGHVDLYRKHVSDE